MALAVSMAVRQGMPRSTVLRRILTLSAWGYALWKRWR